MTPLVTETVTGTLMVLRPSEIVMLVTPLLLEPMPTDVSVNVAVDAGDVVAETVIDAGATVTIVASLLVAVNVPLKPFSLIESTCVPFTPPNVTLVGLATGVGEGDGVGGGVGVGVAVGVGVGVGEAIVAVEAAAVAGAPEAFADVPPVFTDSLLPPPPHATSNATTAIAERTAGKGRSEVQLTYSRSEHCVPLLSARYPQLDDP